jgi:hypothetical protein
MRATNETVLKKVKTLYDMLLRHDGFGEIRIEMRILKRRQKEVIIHCGKQYRYVVDFDPRQEENRATPAAGGGPDRNEMEAPASRNAANECTAPDRREA